MSEPNNLGLIKIRRALISVSDKTRIAEFAAELLAFGYGGPVRATAEEDREATRRTVRPDSPADGTRRTVHAPCPMCTGRC